MKKLITLLIAVVFTACNNTPANFDSSEWGGVISPSDERNDKLNQFIDAYASNDLQSVKDMFSEDAVIQVNDDTMTLYGLFFRAPNMLIYLKLLVLCYWFFLLLGCK